MLITPKPREYCSKCGGPLWDSTALDRLCPRCLHTARANTPPIACTAKDMQAREPERDPPCDTCGHPWSTHGWDGCDVCGCVDIDPMCIAPKPLTPVTQLHKEHT